MTRILSLPLLLLLAAGTIAHAEPTEDEAPLGRYVGGGIGGVVQGNAAGEIFAGYWWENFGLQGGVSVSKSKIDLKIDGREDFTFNDSVSVAAGLHAKAGAAIGLAKPYVGLGLRYSRTEFTGGREDLWTLSFVPSIGADFRISEHIMLGLVVLSIPVIVDGELKIGGLDGDLEGYELEFLSSFSVAFLF